MSQVQEISIQLDGISNVLKTRRFHVPAYQRSYAWEAEHVGALLSDIGDAIKNSEKEYFLGSVVITGPVDRRFDVVDGQQRLTTVSLLIATIRNKFVSEGDLEAGTSIRNDFLASVDRKTKEREPKLTLNEVDNELYQELIEGQGLIDEARYPRQSHKRLLSASAVMRDFIDNLYALSHEPDEELHEWLDYLESNLKVILVIAPDDSNAFVIFETLNDRGLELAISDLLKNYLFHRSADKIEESKNRWLTMVTILESVSDDPLVVTYLRHFAMSRYGLVREKELFGLIKRKVTTKKAALQFASDLSMTARTYAALINTEHELWLKYDSGIRDAVATFNLLGMVQVRPLLLAIVDKFSVSAAAKAFRTLVAVAVRFQIVGGAGGGTLERIYADAAKGVTEGRLKNIDEILKEFSVLPNDSSFMSAFAVATISKQSLARYYLRMLEGASNSELIPNPDVTKVNLEHVLPQTPADKWSGWSQEDARAYVKRLGNLAIVSQKINSTIGNEGFDKKRKELEKSNFAFTKMISSYSQWTPKDVEDRQFKMAEAAVRVWSIK